MGDTLTVLVYGKTGYLPSIRTGYAESAPQGASSVLASVAKPSARGARSLCHLPPAPAGTTAAVGEPMEGNPVPDVSNSYRQGWGVRVEAGVGVGRSRPFSLESELELESVKF